MRKCPIVFQQCSQADRQEITDFLYSLRQELYFSERKVAAGITELLFLRGCVFGGTVNEAVVAMIGVLYGEPARDYVNKEVGFVYVAGLAQRYRGTAAFRTGLRFVLEQFQQAGMTEIRFHALEKDRRLNALYSSFTQPIGREMNPRGLPCVLYGSSVTDALAILDQREKRRHMVHPTPHGRPLLAHANHR